jgi:ribosome-binding protein aMBF1 (putative translation factor)
MQHQDWNTIVLKNINTVPKNVPKNIVKKEDLSKPSINSSVKLNENDEVTEIKYVPKDISQLIINGRLAKKLTRKDLANKLNLKEDVIANIETGKAIYDGNIIAKIKKILINKI